MSIACPADSARLIALQGGRNFRDLGGYRAADGRQVRYRRLYRSAQLGELTDQDHRVVDSLGLRWIVDFRGVDEASLLPARLSAACTAARLPLPIEPRAGAALRDLLADGRATADDAVQLMLDSYRSYARDYADVYGRLLAHIAEDDHHPILFHCTAGKDRTGFGAAVILLALGVPWETVVEDYLLTNRFIDLQRSRLAQAYDAAIVMPMIEVRLEYLQAAFDTLNALYGSFEGYLCDALGCDEAKRRRLHEVLLERA